MESLETAASVLVLCLRRWVKQLLVASVRPGQGIHIQAAKLAAG
jgi:hypothetical protein